MSYAEAKAKYAGFEVKGKTIAVVGLGVIGVLVANACINLGMKVIGYDPYLSIQNAMSLSKEVKYVEKIEDAIKEADFITIHFEASPHPHRTLGYIRSKGVKQICSYI